MLCKKCKTAVSNTDTRCGYCGAKVTQKRNQRILFITLLGIIGLLVTYLIYAEDRNGQQESLASSAAVQEPAPLPEAPPPTPQPEKTEEPTPTSMPDMEKTQAQVERMLGEVLVAVNQFYEDYSPSVAYVSKNGYLYDVPAEAYVKIDEIVDLMDLSPEYAEKNILFFYLKPSDLKGIPDFEVREGDRLEIFAAYETKDGYMASSLRSKGGIISGMDLQRILEKYRGDHGEIVRFSANSNDFLSIVDEIQIYNDSKLGYDVRYLAGDDKYAVAVVSPAGSPEAIEEHVFICQGGNWELRIANFEIFGRYKVEVNSILPDLNLSLLPNYDMRYYTNRMKSNFAEVINAVKSAGMITDSDGAASFASGTTEFVYLEFQSNVKFVGYLNEDNVWVMLPIDDYRAGEAILQSIMKNPPLFIMKQY